MLRRLLTLLVALLWVGALMSAPASARQKARSIKDKSPTVRADIGSTKSKCPFGNTPGVRQGQAKANGYGPGDGTGNMGEGPQDGTGYGPKKGTGNAAKPACDGNGPKGSTKRKGRPQ